MRTFYSVNVARISLQCLHLLFHCCCAFILGEAARHPSDCVRALLAYACTCAGAGKTATVNVLAKELGLELVEWITPTEVKNWDTNANGTCGYLRSGNMTRGCTTMHHAPIVHWWSHGHLYIYI